MHRLALGGALVIVVTSCSSSSKHGDFVCTGAVLPAPAIAGAFVTQPLALRSEYAVLGDCNGDGRLDVVTVDGAHAQDAAGTFGGALPIPQIAASSTAAALADLDGDGVLDLVFAGHVLQVHRGLGGCAFDAPRVI